MHCYDASIGKYAPGYDPAEAKSILGKRRLEKPNSSGKLMKDGKPLVVRIAGWNEQVRRPTTC